MQISEEWRDIEGYEGIYQVSNMGRVRGLKRIDSGGRRRSEMVLNLKVDKRQVYANLRRDNKTTSIRVAKLVATAFVPNKYDFPYIINKDGNYLNNRADNLMWSDSRRYMLDRKER